MPATFKNFVCQIQMQCIKKDMLATAGPHSSAQATVTELQDGLRALDLRIREEVLGHHAELVQQSRQIQGLEAAMQSIGVSVSSLQDAIAQAQQEVNAVQLEHEHLVPIASNHVCGTLTSFERA